MLQPQQLKPLQQSPASLQFRQEREALTVEMFHSSQYITSLLIICCELKGPHLAEIKEEIVLLFIYVPSYCNIYYFV